MPTPSEPGRAAASSRADPGSAARARPKTALVTGASRGIGRAIALSLAAAGLRVAIHHRDSQALADAVAEEAPGGDHVVLRADLADPDEARMLARRAATGLGGLDVVVNNAGIFLAHPPARTDWATWRATWEETLRVNLLGPAHVVFGALEALADGGRIVNVSSRGAFRGEPDSPAYGASKAGLNALGQSLAVALAPRRITVTTVAPGFVETDMANEALKAPRGEAVRAQSPFGRVATAAEVAEAVRWLALDAPEWMSGAILDCNGASYLRT